MKTTLIPMHGASAAPCAVVLPAALLEGTGVPAGLRFGNDVDATGASVDATPPPRGAPV